MELTDTVAVVTGASRGAGRGIALVLGEAGATVYVTGRSTRGDATDEVGGTIDDTADAVTERGGQGIAVECDHTDDRQVARLFDGVADAHGGLDLLVNNVWGGYEEMEGFDAPFWEQEPWRWDAMFGAGVRAHYVATHVAAPLLLEREGLVVNTTFWDRDRYLGSVPYDVAKAAVNRLAYAFAQDFADHGVTAVALSPGWLRTERVLAHGVDDADLDRTESVEYVGRAVAALAADPDVHERTGETLTVGALAREYGFTDVDGSQPPPFHLDAAGASDD